MNRKIIGLAVIIALLALAACLSQEPDATATRGGIGVENLSGPMGILHPLYAYPSNPTAYPQLYVWDEVADIAGTHTAVPYIAIVNPAVPTPTGTPFIVGPAVTPNWDYQFGLNELEDIVKMIVYIDTANGTAPIAQVKTMIDRAASAAYSDWITGVFLDQVSSSIAYDSYYQEIYDHAIAKSTLDTVVLNVGAVTSTDFLMDSGDILVWYENSSLATWQTATPPSWQSNYSSDRFGVLPYSISAASSMMTAIDLAVSRNTGWVYITNDVMDNPFDTLPAYYATEVAYVAEIGDGATNTPTPTPTRTPTSIPGSTNTPTPTRTPTNTPTRTPTRTPSAAVSPSSQVDYGGIYQFFDARGSAPSPYQDGSHQVIPWHLLEPTVGNYVWSELDSYVADRSQYGMHIGLGFNTVDYSPYHCASVGGSQCWAGDDREDRIWLPADMLRSQDQNVTYVVCPLDSTYPRHRLPKYWGSQYLSAYEDFVYALAAHIASTPALANNIDWIELPIGVYGELNPGAGQDRACLQELGLTQDLWEATVQQMIDIWVDAFAGSGIDLSFQGTNFYLDKGNRQRMNDYAASQGLGVQHAKWHPDWEDMAVACTSCWSQGKGMVDAPLRWENQVMFAIEYPDPPLWGEGGRTTLNHAEEDYWNLAAFLDLKGDVYKARLYPRGTLARLTTENPYVQGVMQTLRDLAGKDEQSAPYAVTWMRETEWDWWPKCNNFDFYLYASTAQEPRVGSSCPGLSALTSDGQAVAVYNLDATYAPGLCPNDRVYSATCDPRYRYARQTATDQPYIYLDVDPRYRYGTGVNATISVDYLDVGTDEIRLQWHNGSAVQTESRAKTNTRQWRTWTLTLANMDLTDRFVSGATAWDFRVWDGGDGVETIHSVKFQPANGGTPAAPTATPTATATPAPAATPWRVRVDPASHPWEDALIWLTRPDNIYASLPTYSLRANSDQATNVPVYNTTVASLLVEVPFSLPPNTTLNRATLYLTPTGGYLPDAMTLVLRPVVAEWSLPSWRYRINPDPGVGGVAVPWATPGAYGAGDVGAPFTSVRITADDIAASLPIELDVGGAVQPGGGLALKIEPWCTPSPSTGRCEGFAYFAGSANQNLGIRPYLELDVISNTPPTATPTATRTPTPVSIPPGTATPTATPGGPTRTPTPYPPSLRQGLVINEVCSNPVTTDNVPDGVIQGDSAVELFNSSDEPLDLSLYRLCVDTTCLWLEGTIQPLGYKVWYQQWDGLGFVEGGANTVRLYRAGESPLVLVDTLAIQSQIADHCWAAVTDASPVYVERYPPTLGRGNNWFE